MSQSPAPPRAGDRRPADRGTSDPDGVPPAAPTVALVVIGDEILTGKFPDQNTPWLVRRLRELGLDLVRASVIRDDVAGIAAEVRLSLERADWVITTGGVGPTHDDLTMAGIAEALGVQLERRPELVEVLRRRMGDRLTDDALRMADVPAGAELWWEADVFFPQVVAGRVLAFPGVPPLLQVKFDAIAHRLGGRPMLSRSLHTAAAEAAIASTLREAQQRWPSVAIGSYPRYETRPWTVTVILDSRDRPALDACEAWLRSSLAADLLPDDASTGPG
ncbi:MAG: competence/damage-inducible protein A [Deltaproteobacteria bacterium]|nr:MAG: competence/damage-inducible protein A [Deltaproteobacteria bacterium]